jgi:hypothetical protein
MGKCKPIQRRAEGRWATARMALRSGDMASGHAGCGRWPAIMRALVDLVAIGVFRGLCRVGDPTRGELSTHGGSGQLLTGVVRSSATVERRRGVWMVRRVQAAHVPWVRIVPREAERRLTCGRGVYNNHMWAGNAHLASALCFLATRVPQSPTWGMMMRHQATRMAGDVSAGVHQGDCWWVTGADRAVVGGIGCRPLAPSPARCRLPPVRLSAPRRARPCR